VNLTTGLSISADFVDLRILEYRCVVLRGFFGLSIKPQARNYPILERHYLSPDWIAARRFKNCAPTAQVAQIYSGLAERRFTDR
jgi:hypothetical protein